MHPLYPSFTARTIKGSGRGKGMGTPTINIDLADVPADIKEGIYAGYATIDEDLPAAIHYGPRPVHKDSPSFEVHLLDTTVNDVPDSLEVHLVEYLRPVMDFPSEAALIAQIEDDVSRTRKILHTL